MKEYTVFIRITNIKSHKVKMYANSNKEAVMLVNDIIKITPLEPLYYFIDTNDKRCYYDVCDQYDYYILTKSYKELKEYQFYSNNLQSCLKLFNKIMGGRVNETRD